MPDGKGAHAGLPLGGGERHVVLGREERAVAGPDEGHYRSHDHADGGQDALSAHPGSRVIFHRQLKFFYHTNVCV